MKEEFDFGVDVGLLTIVEELGTVASLEEECLAQSDIMEAGFELLDFGDCNEWWETLEFGKGFVNGGSVPVLNVLLYGFCSPS